MMVTKSQIQQPVILELVRSNSIVLYALQLTLCFYLLYHTFAVFSAAIWQSESGEIHLARTLPIESLHNVLINDTPFYENEAFSQQPFVTKQQY